MSEGDGDVSEAIDVLERRLKLALTALVDLRIALAAQRTTIAAVRAAGVRTGSTTVH